MNKMQLREAAKLSTNAIAKLGRNEPVSLDTLEKICISLSYKIEDIVTFININDQNVNTRESEK